MSRPSKQQIGKGGELLLQYRLLLLGIESAQLTTDAGIDLVAYSPARADALTIQVKTNLKPKPAGGTGKLALDWWIGDSATVDLVAYVDLQEERIWIMTLEEVANLSQQHSSGRYHLYMYVDPTYNPRRANRPMRAYEFEGYLIENRAHELLR